MRTKEQLIVEWNRLDKKSDINGYMAYCAIIGLASYGLGFVFNICFVAVSGLILMVLGAGYCTFYDKKIKDLQDEWRRSGYGR